MEYSILSTITEWAFTALPVLRKGKDWLADVGSRADPKDKTGKKANWQKWDCGQLQEETGKESERRRGKAMTERRGSP